MNILKHTPTRRGVSSLEAIVAFTLITSVLTVSLPLVVRHGRLLMDQRAYRVALDELSNQLDRLTTLPENEIQAALQTIALSEFASARLSGAKLSGTFERSDVSSRVTLRLTWGRPVERTVSLAAWIVPMPQQGGVEPSAESI